jgi:hypothetical protein
MAGSSQITGSQQQIQGGSQVGGSQQQVAGSQQQVEAATPVVAPVYQPRVIQPRVVSSPRPKARRYVPARKVVRRPVRRGLGLPAAKPGQCFAKVKIPATYKNQSRRILIQKASTKRVLVRAPQYRWVNKKVLVRKATYRNRVQAAQYRTTTQRVMVKPAYNTWRKGHGAITRIDNMTGEIMCRVKVPAVYKNVTRRVLVRPARTLRTLVPAVYKTVKQKQRVSSAIYKTVHRPARYKTQNYRVKVGGARYVWRSVLCQTNAPKKHYRKSYRKAPKQYRRAAVKRRPVVRSSYKKQYRQSGINYQDYLRVMNTATPAKAAAKKSKKRIHRKSATKKSMIKSPAKAQKTKSNVATKKGIVYSIQKALKVKGFDPGKMDGQMGPGTAAALKAFQSSRGLPVGQLNKDTFRALGMIR